jgi:hypothetical protein
MHRPKEKIQKRAAPFSARKTSKISLKLTKTLSGKLCIPPLLTKTAFSGAPRPEFPLQIEKFSIYSFFADEDDEDGEDFDNILFSLS